MEKTKKLSRELNIMDMYTLWEHNPNNLSRGHLKVDIFDAINDFFETKIDFSLLEDTDLEDILSELDASFEDIIRKNNDWIICFGTPFVLTMWNWFCKILIANIRLRRCVEC